MCFKIADNWNQLFLYVLLDIFSRIVDAVIVSEEEAKQVQKIIEKMCRKKLGFDLRQGDIVLGQFADMPDTVKATRRTKPQSVGHNMVSSIW